MKGLIFLTLLLLLWTKSVLLGAEFTPIPSSPDTRRIYVSHSEGNDSNDGLSSESPVASLTRGVSLVRDGFPDHLLFKRGDVWTDQKLGQFKSGRSLTEPMVVAYYGDSGPRPKFRASSTFVNFSGKERSHIWFFGLEVVAYQQDPSDPDFVDPNVAGASQSYSSIRLVAHGGNILLEDCRFHYVRLNVQQYPQSEQFSFRGVRINRCMVMDNYRAGPDGSNTSSFGNVQGLYTFLVEDLTIEDCVFDHNGWNAQISTAGANLFNHNVYMQSGHLGNSTVMRNNIVTRGSSHGVQARAGGLIEDNFFGRNTIGILIGYSQSTLPTSVRAHTIHNVVSEGHSMFKGVDNVSQGKTGAYWGIDYELRGDADYLQIHNVVSNRAPNDTNWIDHRSSLNRASYRREENPQVNRIGNIAYHWQSSAEGDDPNFPDPGRTLGSYSEFLGEANDFDAFMEVVKSRPLGVWDVRYTAGAINDFIRAGFGMAPASESKDPDNDGVTTETEWQLRLSPIATDSDNDGTADGQEDADGDGFSNAIEDTLLATNPADASSTLRVKVSPSGDGLVVRFAVKPGRRYQLRESQTLSGWVNTTDEPFLPTEAMTLEVPIAESETTMFYQVLVTVAE